MTEDDDMVGGIVWDFLMSDFDSFEEFLRAEVGGGNED